MTEEPRFLGVHPQFQVADVVAAGEYYRDVLGFEVEDWFGDPPVFTQAVRDAVVIQLRQATHPDSTTRPPERGGYNAYIWVDDVETVAREMRRRGAALVEGPVDREYGCRELVLLDVNGLVLCFAEDVAGPEEDG